MSPLNLVCVRVGDRYGPEYVRVLFDMLLRNLSTLDDCPALWCVTDDQESLPEDVTAIPADPELPGYWQKLRLFSPDMPWNEGERIAYFDLDLAITGRLEDLVETKGIIQDWHWPCYNSSVMIWDHGEHRDVWDAFRPHHIVRAPTLIPPEVLPKGQPNGGDQEFITTVAIERGEPWPVLSRDWCRSYRDAKTWPPSDCRVVCFHGSPKPPDVTGGWVPDVWKVGGFTSLPVMKGVNVSHEAIWANIEANVSRELPRFLGAIPHGGTAVICAGAPSIRDEESQVGIRLHARRGARIITVNNAWKTLPKGLWPDAHVILDARPDNVTFLQEMVAAAPNGASQDTQFFLSSQCDHSLFAFLLGEGITPTLWHNAIGDGARMEALEPGAPQVPGGGTVGLRAIWLAAMSGYRNIHVYGMDSSYHGDVHHAYAQPLNDGEETVELVMGAKRYRCSRWMARQATEFDETWRAARDLGLNLFVHGRGLIPDMCRALRGEALEAA